MKERCYKPTIPVSSGYRAIQDGSRFNAYFPPPEERDRIIIEDGEVTDTVELMEKVVWKYLDDTKRLAPLLKRASLVETCQAIWEFVYSFVQYKLDQRGLEQLRRPARTWAERSTGVDCDCMSIFVSSVLTNLQIPHKFRITRYSADTWQHVYVIVPMPDSKKYCVIDGVVSQFNYEKSFSDKFDYTMNLKGINVAVLSGIAGNDFHDAVMATSLTGYGLGESSEQPSLDKLYQNLVATRNAVAQNPNLVSTVDDPQALLKMLDYAIQYWYTDKRLEALDILAKNEQQLNLSNGLQTVNGIELDPDDLALSGLNIKGFFTNVKTAVKTTTQKVGNKVAEVAKSAVKAVVKFNPLSLAARGGFLLALKLNLGQIGSKLKWAYGTKEQAAAKGVNADTWQKSKNALTKVEALFADKLQGNRTALKNAILNGKAGNLSGQINDASIGSLGDLGEVATASAIAAATPVIIATINILKETGLMGKNENVDINALQTQVSADPGASAMVAQIMANENSNALVPSSNLPSSGGAAPQNDLVQNNFQNENSAAQSGGFLSFIKQNPLPVALGGGLLAFGIYQMVKPKPKSKGLSGYKTKSKAKPKKSVANKSNQRGKQQIKTVKLF